MSRVMRIAAVVTLWLVPLSIFVTAFSTDWTTVWRKLELPSMTPPFLDLYSIPTAIETMHKGGDPLAANPADPLRRPMNYPRIWLYAFSKAGVNRGNVSTVALIFCALYLSCASFLIFQARHGIDAVVLLVASLSLAPLLAIERGNNDLFVFALVFLGCVATNKYVKAGIFGAAALLKIYPIAGLAIEAVRRPMKDRILPALVGAFVIVLLLWQWRDINLIRHGTPASRTLSYGVLSLGKAANHEGLLLSVYGMGSAAIVLTWFAAMLLVIFTWRKPSDLEDAVLHSQFAELFSVFGGIYAFTYAIGSNWDYRLILLLPTLPLALEMARIPQHRRWATTYIVLVGVAENMVPFTGRGGTNIGHLATLALFFMILSLLARQSKSSLTGSETVVQPGEGNERAYSLGQAGI